MTPTQAHLFKLLLEIDAICKKYEIEFYLDYGTALGAIRHEGFIPWDNDLDITMKEADYHKFREACQKELDKGLALDYTDVMPRLMVVAADDKRVLVHDATTADPALHRMLAMMGQTDEAGAQPDDLPVALGVIRNVNEETYDAAVNRQIADVQSKSRVHNFDELVSTLEQWEM